MSRVTSVKEKKPIGIKGEKGWQKGSIKQNQILKSSNMEDNKQPLINYFKRIGRDIKLEIMSVERDAILFKQMQAIQRRNFEDGIEENKSNIDNAETQLQRLGPPPTWTS